MRNQDVRRDKDEEGKADSVDRSERMRPKTEIQAPREPLTAPISGGCRWKTNHQIQSAMVSSSVWVSLPFSLSSLLPARVGWVVLEILNKSSYFVTEPP